MGLEIFKICFLGFWTLVAWLDDDSSAIGSIAIVIMVITFTWMMLDYVLC